MKTCIATSKAPTDFNAYLGAVKQMAEELNVTILGYTVVYGLGCYNHGIMLEGDNSEQFMNQLTMALMPARWSKVADNDPAIDNNQFSMEVVQ